MFTRLLPTRKLAVTATLALATCLAGSAAQAQTIDGTRDASYPAPLAVQTNPTSFGDSSVGAAGNGGANGDELDNISAQIVGANLYLFIGATCKATTTTSKFSLTRRWVGKTSWQPAPAPACWIPCPALSSTLVLMLTISLA
ncbi:hypothetical protein [Hymenobacter sp. BRD67]|uniref:hypothetical protein n=1 Tax=Hymenobacter sp. BRD67 TaxID=2675877 RepID=UPI001564AD53|nr:hypothetical protein [Hymenobacter sp. BRD67]QKG51715.1 hypothetical protein GKZ67_02805 [Hymenobacter sp. BRD67]